MQGYTNVGSSTSGLSDDLRTIQYAQKAAELLFAATGSTSRPTTSQVHSARAQESLRALPPSERARAQSNVQIAKQPQCSYCGVLVVPGWSGSMRLSTLKTGKRNRKRNRRESSTESPSAPTLAPKNRLEWTCSSCGFVSLCPGSDPGTVRRFKKVKLGSQVIAPYHKSAAKAESATTTGTPSEEPRGQIRHAITNSPVPSSPTPPGATSKMHNKNTPEPSKVQLMKQPASSAPVVTPKSSSSAPPPASSAPTVDKKKKRSKREGLQAMLQARREQEEKEKKATSSLGLSSFLQGLQ